MNKPETPKTAKKTPTSGSGNVFFEPWTTPDGVPPFERIGPEQFRPAYAQALLEHEAEVAAIAGNRAPPSFDNTIAAMERSGRALERVGNVFHLLAGAHSNDALLEIEREIAPQLARHWNAINTNAVLFSRIATLMRDAEKLSLTTEQKRVIERYHTGFRRAGAALDAPAKSGSPQSSNGSRRSAHHSARTCWPTSSRSRCSSKTRPSSTACPIS